MKTPHLPALGGLLLCLGAAAFVIMKPGDQRTLTSDSKEAIASYVEGMDHLQQVRYREAIAAWRQALEFDSEFAMPWARLASLSHSWGGQDSTMIYLARAEARVKNASQLEKLRVRQIAGGLRGDEDAERAALEEIVALNPRDIDAHYSLHFIARRTRDPETCYRMLSRVLEIDPGEDMAYNELGYVLADLERWDESLEALRKYAFINADQPNPHDSLGELYERIGRYPEALVEFRRATALDSTFVWSYFHESRVLSRLGRFEESLAALNYSEDHPVTLEFRDLRCVEIWTEAGRFEEATGTLEKLARENVAVPSRYGYEALFHFRTGDHAALREVVERAEAHAETVDPEDAKSVRAAKSVRSLVRHYQWRATGRPDSAAVALRSILSTKEDWFAIEWYSTRLAESHYEAGDLTACLDAIEPILERNPNQAECQFLRGRAKEAQGHLDEAISAYEAALAIWQDGDDSAPLVAQARAALARVQRMS